MHRLRQKEHRTQALDNHPMCGMHAAIHREKTVKSFAILRTDLHRMDMFTNCASDLVWNGDLLGVHRAM
jgi:hypothetical protein